MEINMPGTYTVYGGSLSYFTMKLVSAMSFYGTPFDTQNKSAEIREELETRAGTHQVPVLRTPENWMIADTTPILNLLDQRFPERRMFPLGPIGVLVHLVEEYFDEWIARTMVHYRWHYPRSALFAAEKMAEASFPGADATNRGVMQEQIANWGIRACRATGTAAPTQQQAAEDEYLRLVQAMDRQLTETRFLLGDRPCAVDCVVLGGLRAHTCMDPDPSDQMVAFPRVVNWSNQLATGWDGEGALADFPEGTAFSRLVLAELTNTYQVVVEQNGHALAVGAKAFNSMIYGEEVSYLTREYPERSRQMIKDRVALQLSGIDRQATINWLRQNGLDSGFAP